MIVVCVILAVLLVCACLAAFDMITQLDEDLEHARAERDAARRDVADLTLYAESLEELADSKRPPLRPVTEAPKFASVTDLIAYNEAKRNLTDDRLHSWLDGWGTDGDGA